MQIGIKEVMELMGVGRYTATRTLNKYVGKSRVKGRKYLVDKDNFTEWLKSGGGKQ